MLVQAFIPESSIEQSWRALALLRDLCRQWFAFGDDETRERPVSRCAVVNAFVNLAAFDEECVAGFVGPCWLTLSLDCNRPILNIDVQRSGVRVTAFPSTRRHFDRRNTRSVAGNRQIVLDQHFAHSVRRRRTGGRLPSRRARRKNDRGSGKCIPDRHVLLGLWARGNATRFDWRREAAARWGVRVKYDMHCLCRICYNPRYGGRYRRIGHKSRLILPPTDFHRPRYAAQPVAVRRNVF